MITDTTPTATATDPAAVAADILERAERAWNAADGTAFGDLFTEHADFVDIRGGYHRGRDAIGRGHQGIFDSIYAGSTVAYRLERARLLAPGCIIALASATLDAPHDPLQGVNHARMTLLITEQRRDWTVTAFHNTLVV